MSVLVPKSARRALKKRSDKADAVDEYFERIHRLQADPAARAALRGAVEEMLRDLPADE